MGTPQQPSQKGSTCKYRETTISMTRVTTKRSERTLSELLRVFRAPFSEDQSWAVCYQCARKLQKLSDESSIADIPTLSLSTVYITYTGALELKKPKKLQASESSYQLIKEVISDLGLLVYDLLDYGLDDEEERALPQKFEHLIDCMTSVDDGSCTSDIGSDCDSNSDQILGIIRSSSKTISLQEIIQVCESQVSSSLGTEMHYQLMCKRLFEEAGELLSLAAEGNDGIQDRINHSKKWSHVLKDVVIGKILKKISLTVLDSISSPVLSPHEILQLSIKYFSRDTLKPVLVNSGKETGRITDPHILLMQEIRAIKPKLKPVSERPKPQIMARALTPMEILMEEIRAPPTLRRVQNSYTTVSDSEIIKKKKLIPSIDLVADFTEEPIHSCPVSVTRVDSSNSDLKYNSCTDLYGSREAWGRPRSNSYPSSPDPTLSASQRCISPLCSAQSNLTTQSSASMNAVGVDTAGLEFKSISFSAVNAAEYFPLERRQLHHSWHSDIAICDDKTMEESDSEGELASNDAKSLQSEDELPSSTKELIQIRHILSKADIVNLQLSDNKTYREITRGKLCSACKRRRFSLMSRPHKCIVCQKLVCGKCVSKITLLPDDLPGDHPVKWLGVRRNSNDACIPCKDFITGGGTIYSHQQVPGSEMSHSSSDK